MSQPESSSDTDRAAALAWLWERVIGHVAAMRLELTGPLYEVGHDDVMMREATSDDAFSWLDDCEARLGCDVANAREAMVDYMLARDGEPGAQDVAEALRGPLVEAAARLHANHPVRRGLLAMTEPPNKSA